MEKNEKVSIKYDAFVKAVRPDPKSTENTVYLEGFIGESSVPNHFRLYSDASLNDFIEIPTDAVIHSVAHSKEESALGGSKVWVKKDAVYTYGNPAMTNRPQASFLEGDLYKTYMDSIYQPDESGSNIGAMGGASQPIIGCIGTNLPTRITCIKSIFSPCFTQLWTPICRKTWICPVKTTTIGTIQSVAGCVSLACTATGTTVINPGGPVQQATDFSGGSFNPYFDGDLYQGYMDSMYQPDASGAGMGAMGGGASQPITGCINPTPQTIISKPIICRKSLLTPCVTKPFSPICNINTRPVVCQIKTVFGCPQVTTTIGPIKSIADCPSFPCPTPTFKTETINPNPFGGTGAMSDPSGGSFNPYFDGDLYQGYMDSMYQPETSGIGTQAMGGGMENMASLPLCRPIPPPTVPIRCIATLTGPACNIRSRIIICKTLEFSISRCVICITKDNRASVCNICIPTGWTVFDPTTPVFNPGRINTGGQQFGGDFYGSFDPYSGY